MLLLWSILKYLFVVWIKTSERSCIFRSIPCNEASPDLSYHSASRGPEACLTTAIWRCRKPLNQWQRSFQMKAALPVANQLATASDRSSKTGPRVMRVVIFTPATHVLVISLHFINQTCHCHFSFLIHVIRGEFNYYPHPLWHQWILTRRLYNHFSILKTINLPDQLKACSCNFNNRYNNFILINGLSKSSTAEII